MEAIIMVACTLSFFNNVLIFFMHKSFKFRKKSLGYSIRIPEITKQYFFCDSYEEMDSEGMETYKIIMREASV